MATTNPKNSNPKASLTRAALRAYKTDAKKDIAVAISLLFVEAAVTALAYLASWSLYLTLPFVLIPFCFAIQMSISSYKGGAPLSHRVFFHFFGLYFSPKDPFFGVYRVFIACLKALLVCFITMMAVGFAYYGIAYAVDPSFQSAVDGLNSVVNSGSASDVTTYLEGSAPLMALETAMILSAYGAGFYMLLHSLAVSTLNAYVRMSVVGAPSRVSNAIFNGGFRTIRHPFYRAYYGALWGGIILLILGYLGGIGLGFLLKISNPYTLLACGLGGSFFFTFLYVPYFFNVIELLAERFEKSFADYSIDLARKTLAELKKNQQLSEQEIADLSKKLDEANSQHPQDDSDDDDSQK